MKSPTQRILLILTLLFLLAPLAQQHLGLFEFKPLSGVVVDNPSTELSLQRWKTRGFQANAESYLRLHYGFREPLTRCYNQCVWDLFGKSNQFRLHWLYMSDGHWLLERGSVEEHYQGTLAPHTNDAEATLGRLGDEAFRISQLHHILKPYGIHLFVLLEPGKEQVYPERVPYTTDFSPTPHTPATDFYRQRLDELGVPCLDVASWFAAIKDHPDYPLFPATGTHWSNLAAMHVADSLCRFLEHLGDKRLQHFTIGEPYVKTVEPDDDLEQLMNLARPLKKEPNYFANTVFEADSTADKPKLITIGDSYYWNIINYTPFHLAFSATPYWYYYSSVHLDDRHQNVKELDLLDEVLSSDFVMLAYSTQPIYEMSNGFTQDLLLQLCCDDDDLRQAELLCSDRIRNNPTWLDDLNLRAEKNHATLDEAIAVEAHLSVQAHPERFIPALRDSIPTSRSKKFMRYGLQ